MISIFCRVTKFGLLLTALVLVAALRLAFLVRWSLYDTLAFLLLLSLLLPSLLIMFIPSTFKRPVSPWKALNLRKTLLMASSVRLKPLNCSRLPCVYAQDTLTFLLAHALVLRSRCEVLKASVKALVFGMSVVNNFNCRCFGPLLEDKLCLIFKLAPSVCRMTFPILASLLVRLVVLLPFQLLRLSLATPSRWTPLALSVFLHCVVALLLTLL